MASGAEGPIYQPTPRFAMVDRGRDVQVWIEFVEFEVGYGEPREILWAKSYVGSAANRNDATKLANREARSRGYNK
jgi:hypothetical protein